MSLLESYLTELSQNFTIYCDLDGVLCDMGKAIKKVYPKYTDTFNPKEKKEMWKMVSREGAKFWAYMQWMPGGIQLWNYIINFRPHILTAVPPKYTGDINRDAIKGKRIWVGRELGAGVLDRTHIVTREEKSNYSKHGAILIDDNEKNISEFQQKDGIGILHKNSKDTIDKLKQLGVR